MKGFRVIKPGFLSTFQDAGRFGNQQFGLASSGAMDEISYQWGNALLGNPKQSASLEITLGNCHLEALDNMQIVVTGADLNFQINQQPSLRYQVIDIRKGDQLIWTYPNSGIRSYLSVKGGFNCELEFGSHSTNPRENIGLPLLESQSLHINQKAIIGPQRTFPQSELRDFYQPLTLRLLPTDQFKKFSPEAKKNFFEQTFTISTEFDRTGCRLQAEIPVPTPFTKMISEGITPGTVQIPPDGQPIIMMKDHPTIGGYPKIGTVFSLDLAYLSQCMPHQTIKFKPMSLERAQAIRIQFEKQFI